MNSWPQLATAHPVRGRFKIRDHSGSGRAKFTSMARIMAIIPETLECLILLVDEVQLLDIQSLDLQIRLECIEHLFRIPDRIDEPPSRTAQDVVDVSFPFSGGVDDRGLRKSSHRQAVARERLASVAAVLFLRAQRKSSLTCCANERLSVSSSPDSA